jgi:hypothetical protein
VPKKIWGGKHEGSMPSGEVQVSSSCGTVPSERESRPYIHTYIHRPPDSKKQITEKNVDWGEKEKKDKEEHRGMKKN